MGFLGWGGGWDRRMAWGPAWLRSRCSSGACLRLGAATCGMLGGGPRLGGHRLGRRVGRRGWRRAVDVAFAVKQRADRFHVLAGVYSVYACQHYYVAVVEAGGYDCGVVGVAADLHCAELESGVVAGDDPDGGGVGLVKDGGGWQRKRWLWRRARVGHVAACGGMRRRLAAEPGRPPWRRGGMCSAVPGERGGALAVLAAIPRLPAAR